MREILFRGLRINGKGWVYGYYWIIDEHFTPTLSGINYIKSINNGVDYEVIPESLGQFTGLKDKNGKKIFEGDIVKTPYGIGTIYWDDQYLHYYILFDSEDTNGSDTIDVGWSKDLEIIGNIHDNEKLK